MRIKSDIEIFKVDKAKYYKYFERNMLNVLKQAVSEGALEAAKIVPVWSGQAKGAFLAKSTIKREEGASYSRNAESFLGLVDAPSSIDITSHVKIGPGSKFRYKGKYKLHQIYYLSGEKKGKESGARRSGYYFYISKKKSFFYFETRISYWSMYIVKKIWPDAAFIIFERRANAVIEHLKNTIIPNENDYIIKVNTRRLKGRPLLPERFTGTLRAVRERFSGRVNTNLLKFAEGNLTKNYNIKF